MRKIGWMAGLIAGLVLCFGTTGCAVHKRMKMAEKGTSELVGLSKTDLMSCAGVPVRSEKVDDLEFFTYTSGGTGGFFCQSGRYCEVTFTLQNNVVKKVSYSGNTGGYFSEGEQCAYAIAPCLKKEE
jgi:hypothetical protein